MSETPNNLASALCAVMRDTPAVGKSGYNAFQKYKYSTESDIFNAVRPHLVEHGIAVMTDIIDVHTEPHGSKGETLYRVMVRYTLMHAASGESASFTAVGQATSKDEKGVYGALTGAAKYAWSKMLLISTDDDPEAIDGQGRRTTSKDAPRQPQGAKNPSEKTTTKGSVPAVTLAQLEEELGKYLGPRDRDRFISKTARATGASDPKAIPANTLAAITRRCQELSPKEASDWLHSKLDEPETEVA